MSDNQKHRGAHPADRLLFAPKHHGRLRRAAHDLSWLLSHGYATSASLKLVGDHFSLKERQRLAVVRAACSDQQRAFREQIRLPLESIKSRNLLIDGFNILITLEAALSGGALIKCRDGCVRDLSSVHGSYRTVAETEAAIRLAGEALSGAGPASTLWLLDRPVSNSGRLAQKIREMAVGEGWPWQVDVVMNPDKVLRASGQIVVTSDSNVLDGVTGWVNLGGRLIAERLPEAWVIDLEPSNLNAPDPDGSDVPPNLTD
jgi:hypothetical protein